MLQNVALMVPRRCQTLFHPKVDTAFLELPNAQCTLCLSQLGLPCNKYHRRVLSHSPEAGSPRSRCGLGWFLLGPLFLDLQMATFSLVLTWLSLWAHAERGGDLWCISSSSYNDPSPIRSGPTLVTSFNRNYLLKGLICKHNHIGDQHVDLGDTVQSVAPSETARPELHPQSWAGLSLEHVGHLAGIPSPCKGKRREAWSP